MSRRNDQGSPAASAASHAPHAQDEQDAKLIDSLYARRQDALEDDDDDLAQLQRLRSVFAELRTHQEEPPPAGMALLMAAARQAVEERKPTGLWARLRAGWMMMAAHPAMSAATAAVVVLGAAGYMATRGMGDAVEATAPSAEATRATGAAEPSATLTDGKEDRGPAAAPATAGLPAATAPAAPAPADSSILAPAQERAGEFKVRKAAPTKSEAIEQAKPASGSRGKDAQVDKADSPADGRGDQPADPSLGLLRGEREKATAPVVVGGDVGTGGGASVDSPAPEAEAPAPPAPSPGSAAKPIAKKMPAKPKPPTATKPDALDDAAEQDREASAPADKAQDEEADRTRSPKVTRSAERWYTLARAAAAKGDCEAVKLLGARVQAEDPGFYDTRFRKDAAIKKCL